MKGGEKVTASLLFKVQDLDEVKDNTVYPFFITSIFFSWYSSKIANCQHSFSVSVQLVFKRNSQNYHVCNRFKKLTVDNSNLCVSLQYKLVGSGQSSFYNSYNYCCCGLWVLIYDNWWGWSNQWWNFSCTTESLIKIHQTWTRSTGTLWHWKQRKCMFNSSDGFPLSIRIAQLLFHVFKTILTFRYELKPWTKKSGHM